MLLTLYYMTSTWILSWRLNSMKNTFIKLFSKNTSVVLYKEKTLLDLESNGSYESLGLYLRGITSDYCINKSKAHVLDLWCYKFQKRGCSVLPVQTVNISNWISIPTASTYFPIKLQNDGELILKDEKISLLLEASFLQSDSVVPKMICQLENYGVPKAWTANEYFAIILETDVDHLTRLGSDFMFNELHLNDIMEIIRLETVTVLGNACELLNVDRIPILIYSLKDTTKGSEATGDEKLSNNSSEWKTFHVQMLRKVARSAEELQQSGNSAIILDYPPVTVIKSGFLKPEATISTEQLSPRVSENVEGKKNFKNGVSRSCSEDTSGSLFVQPGSTTCSLSAVSRCSIDTAVTESPMSTKVFSTDELDWKKSSRSSLSTAETVSLAESGRKIPTIPLRHKGEKKTGKPPNIIVFSESPSSVENIKTSLNSVLCKHRYTVYSLSLNDMLHSPWMQQASLVVLCGNVPVSLKPLLLRYLLHHGGQLLCLCSDLLGVFLPTFKTAEVRPDEVVSFSFDKWDHITLLHHIFCYQPSPKSSKFSMDESPSSQTTTFANVPPTVELLDTNSKPHTLQVEVLAAEKTWQTPTLLLASSTNDGAKALFSQVHLEVDSHGNSSGTSDPKLRLALLSELLSNYLGLECDLSGNSFKYTPAYFLGRHERKLEFLEKLASHLKPENELQMKNMKLKFCGKGVASADATDRILPVKLYDCPQNFSTVEYFDNLQTENLGRLVVYSELMTSSMEILSGPVLEHGFVAISRQQTCGVGRGGNAWISPEGCAMFSMQLHIPLSSTLGERLSLLQHIIALSIVSAIRSEPGYEDLCLGLKWPNDIYAGGMAKIGGLIITSSVSKDIAVCNAGCGVNLNNSVPTTCINDMIAELNQETGQKLRKISLEKYFALVFTQLEKLLNSVQEGGIDMVFDLYYKYWLHNFAEVKITKSDGTSQAATIIGLDDYGFLKVRGERGEIFSVQPDGNTFDMLSGLIAPK